MTSLYFAKLNLKSFVGRFLSCSLFVNVFINIIKAIKSIIIMSILGYVAGATTSIVDFSLKVNVYKYINTKNTITLKDSTLSLTNFNHILYLWKIGKNIREVFY